MSMSMKQFIESEGADCRNWRWSWSFINEQRRIIIFRAWDKYTEGDRALILKEDWEYNEKGRKQPGYAQSIEHIRLIEEEGYKLKTFPIEHSDANKDEDGRGPAKIESFEAILTEKTLKKIGNDWYAI